MGIDPNQSPLADSRPALRALLNSTIREVYRGKSNDQKFIRDIVVRNTIAMTDGVGACPDTIMREHLKSAQFQDTANSLIAYFNYNIDKDSGVNFSQLGYVVMQGDDFVYTAPAPVLDTYSGDMFVTVASFPVFPADMADPITLPSESTVDDICLTLALAIRAELKFDLTGAMAA